MLESELSCYERGAFTGAHALKIGLLEATDGGTVFLDEIGELPLGTRPAAARTEERIVTRVGSTKTKRIDVRFVTATNRDLAKEVKSGRFRGDLYYRISGPWCGCRRFASVRAEVESAGAPLPARVLRASGVIPSWSCSRRRSSASGPTQWSGNVRELKNVMERAALLANHGVITEEEILLEHPEPEPDLSDIDDDFDSDTAVFHAPDPAFVDRSERGERDRIVRALELCGGNQTRAAKMLGVSRRTLINRLEQFNLPRPKKG